MEAATVTKLNTRMPPIPQGNPAPPIPQANSAETAVVTPQVVEITVNFHGGGKVALEAYNAESSDYGASLSRRYAIPPFWTETQVAEFETQKVLELREELEPLLQAERDERFNQRLF